MSVDLFSCFESVLTLLLTAPLCVTWFCSLSQTVYLASCPLTWQSPNVGRAFEASIHVYVQDIHVIHNDRDTLPKQG